MPFGPRSSERHRHRGARPTRAPCYWDERTETQARDIFDLKLLCDAGAAATPLRKAQLEQLPQAIENAMSIGFEDFVGQVVAFLEPEHQADFGNRASWETPQEQVVDSLRGLAQ
ncbi:MAG TPA: hypothetical protein VLI71_11130 [Gammaproteobacteria bacterium]|nr:hypothetical protein [Gammaproteobacteria bacterium]